MKRNLLLLFALMSGMAASLAAQSVYVEDFTTTQEDIRPFMSGATGVLRSALLQNTVAEFTDSQSSAAYMVSGTVTRFGAVNPPEKNGGNFSGSANVAINLFNFLAPSLQTGHIGSQNQAQPDPQAEPCVVVSVRLVETGSGRITASGTISAVTWEDYIAKTAGLARELGRSLPFPETAFAGVWEAFVEHGAYEDSYRINFRTAGQCSITVTSADTWGNVNTQTAEGRYTWNDEILRISARFADNAIPHVRSIDWRAVIRLSADRRSFTMTIPTSHQAGALRVGAQFWKEERP